MKQFLKRGALGKCQGTGAGFLHHCPGFGWNRVIFFFPSGFCVSDLV